MQIRYKAHFYAHGTCKNVEELKDIPVDKAKRMMKQILDVDNGIDTIILIAYGFEQRTKYKITRTNPKWKIEE